MSPTKYALLALVGLTACAEFGMVDAVTDPDPIEAALEQCQSNLGSLEKNQRLHRDELGLVRSEIQSLSDQLSTASELCDTRTPPAVELIAATESPMPADSKLVVGSLERIWVEALQLALPARIDTGAETASLDARNISNFERDGKPWVSFEIPDPAGGDPIVLERRRVREALVIQASSVEPERRPVIRLGIQLGPVRQLAEFTLSNRSHLDYQMLVGRNILRDVMLVDVSEDNLVPLPNEVQGDQSTAP